MNEVNPKVKQVVSELGQNVPDNRAVLGSGSSDCSAHSSAKVLFSSFSEEDKDGDGRLFSLDKYDDNEKLIGSYQFRIRPTSGKWGLCKDIKDGAFDRIIGMLTDAYEDGFLKMGCHPLALRLRICPKEIV
jgi:hypothetical protein